MAIALALSSTVKVPGLRLRLLSLSFSSANMLSFLHHVYYLYVNRYTQVLIISSTPPLSIPGFIVRNFITNTFIRTWDEPTTAVVKILFMYQIITVGTLVVFFILTLGTVIVLWRIKVTKSHLLLLFQWLVCKLQWLHETLVC